MGRLAGVLPKLQKGLRPHSSLIASIALMLSALIAGMNPAKSPATTSIDMAIIAVPNGTKGGKNMVFSSGGHSTANSGED